MSEECNTVKDENQNDIKVENRSDILAKRLEWIDLAKGITMILVIVDKVKK